MSVVATAAPTFGHNETAVRLGILANDAQLALERVAKGEGDAIDGWLDYGAALNEGRALFPGKENDRAFGEWCAGIMSSKLEDIHPAEQAAAMWAAANPEQFEEARAAGNARTVRGIYAKWNEINAERAAEEARAAAEKARTRVFGGPARAPESKRDGPPKRKVSKMTLAFPKTYAKAQMPLAHTIREGRMEVTPALAERILVEAKYEKQRKAFPHHIALLADSMRRDLWTAGSQIAFVHYEGRLFLVNGQHRMHAVIEAGRPVEFQVLIEEASSEKEVSAIYYRFDVQQRQRSLSEVLNATDIAATYKISKTLANATFKAAGIIANRMEIPNYQKDPIKARSVDSRLDAARHWWGVAARFGEMIEPAPESVRNRLRNPGILAVALMTIRYQPEKAEEFWKGLAENDGLRKGDPRQTLINDLMVRHMGSGRQGQGIIVAANAWSAFYEGRAIRHLKVSANAVVRIAGTPFDGRRR